MPTTINQLRSVFNLAPFSRVAWNERIQTKEEGLYIVSLSDDPDSNRGSMQDPPISQAIIEAWIKKVNGFELDKVVTRDVQAVIARLSKFWLPDESIIYIGKAPKRGSGTGLGKRVQEFYSTDFGERRPHAGGHWIKALSILKDTSVYFVACENPGEIELDMLNYFCENVSPKTRRLLRDPELALPFGNLQLNPGQIKMHGLGKMKL